MKINKSKRNRIVSLFLLIVFSQSVILPTTALALTGGPSQPEVESFTPVGMTDLVDMFSGDFKYNIPLIDAGGYPINLSYNAGPNMEQEASWVGLGWNLNPGVINRSLRGLPDDFHGEEIENKIYQKPNWTFSLGGATLLKLFGVKMLNTTASLGLKYNSYNGLGLDFSMSLKPNFSSLKSSNLEEEDTEDGDLKNNVKGPEKLSTFIKNRLSMVKTGSYWMNVGMNLYPELNLPIKEGKIDLSKVGSYLDGVNNPRDLARLFNYNEDVIVFLNRTDSEPEFKDYENVGLTVMRDYCYWLSSAGLLPKERWLEFNFKIPGDDSDVVKQLGSKNTLYIFKSINKVSKFLIDRFKE